MPEQIRDLARKESGIIRELVRFEGDSLHFMSSLIGQASKKQKQLYYNFLSSRRPSSHNHFLQAQQLNTAWNVFRLEYEKMVLAKSEYYWGSNCKAWGPLPEIKYRCSLQNCALFGNPILPFFDHKQLLLCLTLSPSPALSPSLTGERALSMMRICQTSQGTTRSPRSPYSLASQRGRESTRKGESQRRRKGVRKTAAAGW